MQKKSEIVLGLLRIGMGWLFLWTFIDKLFGLGFSTAAERSWLNGTSPTAGFLDFGTSGPLAGFFQSLSGSAVVDWLYMMGMLLVGVALLLGVGVRIAGYAGALMMWLIWLATLPLEHNPFFDEHIVYVLVLLLFVCTDGGQYLGLGRWWREKAFVEKNRFLL